MVTQKLLGTWLLSLKLDIYNFILDINLILHIYLLNIFFNLNILPGYLALMLACGNIKYHSVRKYCPFWIVFMQNTHLFLFTKIRFKTISSLKASISAFLERRKWGEPRLSSLRKGSFEPPKKKLSTPQVYV